MSTAKGAAQRSHSTQETNATGARLAALPKVLRDAADAAVTTEVVGRGFTKRVLTRTRGDVLALLKAFALRQVPGPRTFQELRDALVAYAQEKLRAAGLPDRRTVYYLSPGQKDWTCEEPEDTLALFGGSTLTHFVVTIRGYAHDSDEGFAARIVEAAWESEQEDQERALCGAYELGRVSAEARSYAFQARTGATRKRRENGAKAQLRKLLAEIVRTSDCATEQQLWDALACHQGEAPQVDLEGTPDRPVIVAHGAGTSWHCARASFYKLLRDAREAPDSDDRA